MGGLPQQGLHDILENEPDIRKMGDFLKWLGGDVKKEGVSELEASNLEWKNVAKAVNAKASRWLMAKAKELA